MSYDSDESSVATGEPQEGYEFIGSATTWRYASGLASVTIDGNAYAPLAGLRRGSISLGTTRDTPTLMVDLPITAQVVQHYAFSTPPRSLRLKVYRQQTNSAEWIVAWDGEVRGISVKGNMATVSVPSALGERLSTTLPTLTVRRHCLHFLYDARCRVARASFDLATTVASVSADGRTVVVAGVGGNPDDWFRAGEIVRDADSERRSIIGQTGTTLLISAPFRTLANPDAVTLYAGCDHTAATCESKFANLNNFSGCPSLPTATPFGTPLLLGDA